MNFSLLKSRRLPVIIALVLIIGAGTFLRLDDLGKWRQYEQKTFFNNQPIHTTFDAWFYLSLARDLINGAYQPVDEKRGIPDSPPRPAPPPLISVIAAGLAGAGNFSLSWIGALLPVFLGPLLAIPLYLLGRFYGGRTAGLTAALIGTLAPLYVYRSGLGRFDTDCLNVTMAVTAVLLFLHFGTEITRKRYYYFLGGAVVYGLFLWWWDQTPEAVTAICLMPLGIALAFFYRPSRKEGLLFFGLLGLAAAAFLLLRGPGLPLKIMHNLWSKFNYISKETAGFFPNTGITISEQNAPSLAQIMETTTGTLFQASVGSVGAIIAGLPFFAALAGIFLLIWRRPKESLFLLPLVVLSAGSFYANRFLIFLAPLLGLGAGCLLAEAWRRLQNRPPIRFAIGALLIITFALPLYRINLKSPMWPKESGPVVAGMAAARQKTPPDAVIWAWWDHGYALNFYADRATINDGSVHNGERTVYSAVPLVADNYRLAANFMQFYTVRGLKGIEQFYTDSGIGPAAGLRLIKQIMRAGPRQGRASIAKAGLRDAGPYRSVDDWLRFFFPVPQRPVYLFLDELLLRTSYWWYWFGTWDINRQDGVHPVFQTFYANAANGKITGSRGLRINTDNGEMYVGNYNIKRRLTGIFTLENNRRYEKSYNNNTGLYFGMVKNARFGAYMNKAFADSVFNRLFLRGEAPDKYFRPVSGRSLVYQLWEIRGDSIR